MSNIFTLDKFDNFSEKINIDELYENKKNRDLQTLQLYQKLLNRVHVRIKDTTKRQKNTNCCWFIVPEVIIGVPKYDNAGCIAYLIDKLKENQFLIQYYHPNTLFINWNHWVPSYIRTEFKKKTGQIINEFGAPVSADDNSNKPSLPNSNLMLFNNDIKQKESKKFTPINEYIPTGNFN